jgi:hypothetical protein
MFNWVGFEQHVKAEKIEKKTFVLNKKMFYCFFVFFCVCFTEKIMLRASPLAVKF